MFKKNDPLVGAVQKIMAENAIRYQVEQKLCEELGIYSKNALPNEHKANFDALLDQRINEALHPNQQKLDVHEPEKDKLTAQDFKMLRSKKKEPQGADYAEKRRKARMANNGRMDEAEDTSSTDPDMAAPSRGPGYKDEIKPKASAPKEGPSASDRNALTNKIKSIMNEAKMRAKQVKEEGDSHEIEFADKPGQKFKAAGKETDAPKDYNTLTHDAPGKSKGSSEPGYSGEAGKTLQKAISPGKSSDDRQGHTVANQGKMPTPGSAEDEDDDKAMLAAADKMNKANMELVRRGGDPKDMKRDMGTDKDGNTKYLSPVYPVKPDGTSAGPGKGGQAGYRFNRKTISQKSFEKDEDQVDESAKSKSQQRLFGAALATRRGESEPASRKIAKLAADVPEKELKKFASTKLKGLPEKKKVSESEEISFNSIMEEIKRNLGKKKVKEIEEQDEDPNKPYQDTPLSPGDVLDARQTADKMQSTPAAAPEPAAKPAPTAAAAPAPSAPAKPAGAAPAADNRSWLQKALNMAPRGRNAPAPTGPGQTVAQQASAGKAAVTMRNVAAGLGQNAADKTNATQNVVKPGEANAAAGQAMAPKPETGAGLSKVSNPNSPEVKAKVASVAANDAARSPVDVDKAITGAANVEAPAPVSGLDKPKPQSFGQAFAAARKAAGGAGGKFTYNGKEYQTNIKGEKYQPASKLKAVRESLESTINNILKG